MVLGIFSVLQFERQLTIMLAFSKVAKRSQKAIMLASLFCIVITDWILILHSDHRLEYK